MDQDLKIFKSLLLWIFRSHVKPVDYDDDAQEIYRELGHKYPNIGDDKQLEALLPASGRIRAEFPRGAFLYLKPIRDGLTFVPIMCLKSDFSCSIPRLSIRLGLFLKHDNVIKAFGYRFESPEGLGEHHYYHAQLIHGFEKHRLFLETDSISWLPDSYPAFPLDADNPVALVLSLLIALYGMPYVAKEIKLGVIGIDHYLMRMRPPTFRELEWYFRVSPASDPMSKKSRFYATVDPDIFIADIRHRHAKVNVVGITKDEYENQPQKLRCQWKPGDNG